MRILPFGVPVNEALKVYMGGAGHYVVICGYDLETDEFEIRDPASSR
jgi:hypothetical protein